jgi:hypothetical protein
MYFSHLGRVHAELGKLEHGPAIQRRRDVGCETRKESWYEADVHRIAGDIALLPQDSDASKVSVCRRCLPPPLFATLATRRFDQQVVPRGYSLHTNFRAVELSLAQIGRLACDKMFPFVGHEVLGTQAVSSQAPTQPAAASQQCSPSSAGRRVGMRRSDRDRLSQPD